MLDSLEELIDATAALGAVQSPTLRPGKALPTTAEDPLHVSDSSRTNALWEIGEGGTAC